MKNIIFFIGLMLLIISLNITNVGAYYSDETPVIERGILGEWSDFKMTGEEQEYFDSYSLKEYDYLSGKYSRAYIDSNLSSLNKLLKSEKSDREYAFKLKRNMYIDKSHNNPSYELTSSVTYMLLRMYAGINAYNNFIDYINNSEDNVEDDIHGDVNIDENNTEEQYETEEVPENIESTENEEFETVETEEIQDFNTEENEENNEEIEDFNTEENIEVTENTQDYTTKGNRFFSALEIRALNNFGNGVLGKWKEFNIVEGEIVYTGDSGYEMTSNQKTLYLETIENQTERLARGDLPEDKKQILETIEGLIGGRLEAILDNYENILENINNGADLSETIYSNAIIKDKAKIYAIRKYAQSMDIDYNSENAFSEGFFGKWKKFKFINGKVFYNRASVGYKMTDKEKKLYETIFSWEANLGIFHDLEQFGRDTIKRFYKLTEQFVKTSILLKKDADFGEIDKYKLFGAMKSLENLYNYSLDSGLFSEIELLAWGKGEKIQVKFFSDAINRGVLGRWKNYKIVNGKVSYTGIKGQGFIMSDIEKRFYETAYEVYNNERTLSQYGINTFNNYKKTYKTNIEVYKIMKDIYDNFHIPNYRLQNLITKRVLIDLLSKKFKKIEIGDKKDYINGASLKREELSKEELEKRIVQKTKGFNLKRKLKSMNKIEKAEKIGYIKDKLELRKRILSKKALKTKQKILTILTNPSVVKTLKKYSQSKILKYIDQIEDTSNMIEKSKMDKEKKEILLAKLDGITEGIIGFVK